jgi:hypothetical protein
MEGIWELVRKRAGEEGSAGAMEEEDKKEDEERSRVTQI